ncbi:MAG TPA: formate dehydrogenase [Burkholderiaceae bacterium]
MSEPLDAKPKQAESPLKRRGLLLGAGAVGVGALATKALSVSVPDAAVAAVAAPKVAETAGGYQLSAHVLRYYETARA